MPGRYPHRPPSPSLPSRPRHPELDGTFDRGDQAGGTQRRAPAGSIAAFAGALLTDPDTRPDALLARIARMDHKHVAVGVTGDRYAAVHKCLHAGIGLTSRGWTSGVYHQYTRRVIAFVKATGTALVAVLLCQPWWAPQWGRGLLGEVGGLGAPAALAVVLVFFGLVALYCRALQRMLACVRPGAAVRSPASVWWMFAIPYNFTEDFFIVHAGARSLAADGRTGARFVRRWAVLGHGWCAFQVLSLFPGAAGHVGGAVAVPLWVAHWGMTVRARRTLAPVPRVAPSPTVDG